MPKHLTDEEKIQRHKDRIDYAKRYYQANKEKMQQINKENSRKRYAEYKESIKELKELRSKISV